MKQSHSSQVHPWFPAILAAAAASGTLAAADTPAHPGGRRVGTMVISATEESPSTWKPTRTVQRASATVPPPAPAVESAEEPATTQPQLALPAARVFVPDPAHFTGVQDSRYESSAWPRASCPPPCSDIAFRPFGDSVMLTMGRQIYHGSAGMMMLYDYDFHSADVTRAAELTPRGLYQLRKFARRLEFTPAPITIQFSETDPALNTARWQNVVSQLSALGLANADSFVVFGRERFGVPATEAVQTAAGLDYVIETRGRTVTPDNSARFGTGQVFSGFGR
jgi:hypothetical protein